MKLSVWQTPTTAKKYSQTAQNWLWTESSSSMPKNERIILQGSDVWCQTPVMPNIERVLLPRIIYNSRAGKPMLCPTQVFTAEELHLFSQRTQMESNNKSRESTREFFFTTFTCNLMFLFFFFFFVCYALLPWPPWLLRQRPCITNPLCFWLYTVQPVLISSMSSLIPVFFLLGFYSLSSSFSLSLRFSCHHKIFQFILSYIMCPKNSSCCLLIIFHFAPTH